MKGVYISIPAKWNAICFCDMLSGCCIGGYYRLGGGDRGLGCSMDVGYL